MSSLRPGEPYVSEPVRADLLDYMGTTRVLLSMLGFPLLEDLDAPGEPHELLFCRIDKLDIQAKEKYTEEGLVVFKGSQARLETVNDND